MSNFSLNVESPYPRPEMKKLAEKPDVMKYPGNKIRFSYYGFGNLICFLLIFLLNNFQERAARIIYMMAITSYFLFLNHWNSPEVISYTSYIKVSFFLFIASFALESSKK